MPHFTKIKEIRERMSFTFLFFFSLLPKWGGAWCPLSHGLNAES